MNKISGVYSIVNNVTGDLYIGSSKNIKKRWTTHKSPSTHKRHPNVKLYQAIAQKKVTAQGNESTYFEYYISIDMAKEICMIQRSEIGRKFRQYFIECEKRLIESNRRAMPQTYIEAIESLLNELKKNQALEEKGKLLLEQKEKAEAETERIIQYNKNFHSHLYTVTDLAKMLGTNPYKIGKIANEHHLKQEPLYGKLGKIQLNNGRWVEIFYYNEDAKLVIENNL